MGMLSEARKDASKSKSDKEHLKPDVKHKKHKGKPSTELPSNAAGATPGDTESDIQPAEAEPETDDNGGADQSAPEAGADEGAQDADPGAAPSPAPPGAAPAAPDDQGDQSAQDAQAQGPQPDQQGGASDQEQGQDDGAAGAQGETPEGAAPEDDSPDASGAQDGHVDLSKIPISPALREEFMRCNAALYTALYKNDKVAQGVMSGIVPDGPHKVESAARMATLLLVQINKQLKFIQDTPQVVMPFTQDVVTHVLDLAQQVKHIQFSEQEAHAVLGTALEIILHTTGVNKKQMQALQHAIPRSQIMDGADKYKQHLAFIKGVPGPNDPSQGAAPGGPAPPADPNAQGAPPAAAPDQAPGGAPQAGAPVTAAPGPGQSAPPGGMLSQAAAQAPGGA